MTNVDLTGGLGPERDELLDDVPENPKMRDAANVWVHDDEGRFCLPRFGVERLGETWNKPATQANIAFAGGRVLVASGIGDAHPTRDGEGRPRVIGSGPLRLECGEPFQRWTLSYRGDALDTNVEDQQSGTIPDGPRVDVEIDVDMTMTVPPWVQDVEGRPRRAHDQGHRHEQLFTATGTLRVAGEEPISFSGSGLRIRRQGVRYTGEFSGHTWQAAVFPSGRAFGYLAYPERSDGSTAYRDGFVFDGERTYPAVPVEIPWVTTFVPEGGTADAVLESELGNHKIKAVTTTSSCLAGTAALSKVAALSKEVPGRNLFLHQGGPRYTWDGETAYGMIERSLPIVLVSNGLSGES